MACITYAVGIVYCRVLLLSSSSVMFCFVSSARHLRSVALNAMRRRKQNIAEVYGWMTRLLVFPCGTFFAISVGRLIHALLRRNLFVARKLTQPLALMRVVHDALREACDVLTELSDRFSVSNVDNTKNFCTLFHQFALVYKEHSKHEENVVYAHYRSVFPNCTADVDEEHERDHALMHEVGRDDASLHYRSFMCILLLY